MPKNKLARLVYLVIMQVDTKRFIEGSSWQQSSTLPYLPQWLTMAAILVSCHLASFCHPPPPVPLRVCIVSLHSQASGGSRNRYQSSFLQGRGSCRKGTAPSFRNGSFRDSF